MIKLATIYGAVLVNPFQVVDIRPNRSNERGGLVDVSLTNNRLITLETPPYILDALREYDIKTVPFTLVDDSVIHIVPRYIIDIFKWGDSQQAVINTPRDSYIVLETFAEIMKTFQEGTV